MVQINFAQKQVNAKIVYYGPGMSGKTTNLEVIHQRAPEGNRGDLTSISTDGDRTLFFDFMPLDLGTVAGMRTCFQVYTVPGQVYYNSTRKLVLQGVDGVIFIADSSPDMMEENLESMRNLVENLEEYGRDASEIPLVIQYNKRDIPGALPIAELEAQLNQRGVPAFEGVANTGQGVFPTLKAVAAAVLDTLHKQSSGNAGAAPQTAPAPEEPQAMAQQPGPTAIPPIAPLAHAPEPKPAEDRETISMSQTGFHKAPSVPLEAAGLQASAPPEPAPAPPSTPEPVQESAGLQMAQPFQPEAPPAPASAMATHAQGEAVPAMQGAAGARQQGVHATAAPAQPRAATTAETIGSQMAVAPTAQARVRKAPASKSFTPRSQQAHATPKGGKKKSAAMTLLIVIASVGVGAALGSFVLSIL